MEHLVQTPRLTLRRPVDLDRAPYVALQTDPRLYTHSPHSRMSEQGAAGFHAQVLDHWAEHGFGYWTAVDRASGEPVGLAGVRVAGDGSLNLAYRFAVDTHGRGLGRESARAAVAFATEWLSDRPVRATIRPAHDPSIRTALSAGLVEVGTVRHPDDLPDEAPSRLFEAPRVTRTTRLGDDERDEVLDLWCRVNDAGGSVGFRPGAPVDQVAQALAAHEDQMRAGDAVAGVLREPDGTLIGCAWWVRSQNPLLHHGRWLYRLMVDPQRQGRNLGRLLVAGMHRIARDDGAELLQLGYRSGSGLGDFYAACGYAEVGRTAGAIRVGPGDDRDDVTMARRVDGRPLVPHGGS